MSYSFDTVDLCAQAASYIDRILKGASPADLPVQQPTKYSLIINLNTAKALGLEAVFAGKKAASAALGYAVSRGEHALAPV